MSEHDFIVDIPIEFSSTLMAAPKKQRELLLMGLASMSHRPSERLNPSAVKEPEAPTSDTYPVRRLDGRVVWVTRKANTKKGEQQ